MAHAARITGIGSAFPRNIVTNADIARKLSDWGLHTSDDWIRSRTGICERRHSVENDASEFNSSLGLAASCEALEMAGKRPQDIDQIVYATFSPDTLMPSTACWLQHKLGAKRAWAVDINAACTGFVYGASIVEQFIRSGQVKTALVVGGDVFSRFINWTDRSSCILFGDGAGAAVVEHVPAQSDRRILSTHLHSDGEFCELLYIPAGGSNIEVSPDRYLQNHHKMQMNGKEIFKVAVRTMTRFAKLALDANHMTIQDLDWFVPHQANIRILKAVAQRLGLPAEKIVLNIDRYGNTSAATIPTALCEAVNDGRIQPGNTALLNAFGAGLTNGAMMLKW